MGGQSSAYRDAGVDIDAKYAAVKGATAAIRATHTAGVKGEVGAFGGIFDLAAAGAAGQYLVASTDGVGTKVKVAQRAGRLGGVGADLVNHCVNDILVQGARPLFFLDYIAMGRMVPDAVQQVLGGLTEACRENQCALLGGETAEMPGVYVEGELDVAGTIVGAVAPDRVLDGSRVEPGDRLIALPSSGLHTNGYSLARRVVFDKLQLTPADRPAELGGESVADALLAVHRSYYPLLWPFLEQGRIHAMAHITGGGLLDNVPRVLPAGTAVEVRVDAMPRLPIFDLLVEGGGLERDEAYRVFNMGFGMVLVAAADDAEALRTELVAAGEPAELVGEVVQGGRDVHLL